MREDETLTPDLPFPPQLAWKADLEANIRRWLEELTEPPAIEKDGERAGHREPPDLYSFYEALCVLKSEFRKNARRSHETFSRFGETLDEFQEILSKLDAEPEGLVSASTGLNSGTPHRLYLPLVELYDRMLRLGARLQEGRAEAPPRPIPAKTLWQRIRSRIFPRASSPGGAQTPEQTPISAVADGFFMILSHFEALLAQEDILRIPTTGRPFDPFIMTAVEAREQADLALNTVIEEISPGYLWGEQVLKLAAVVVSTRKG